MKSRWVIQNSNGRFLSTGTAAGAKVSFSGKIKKAEDFVNCATVQSEIRVLEEANPLLKDKGLHPVKVSCKKLGVKYD